MSKKSKKTPENQQLDADALAAKLALSAFAYAPTDLPDDFTFDDPFSQETYEVFKDLLKQRVKPSRYKHSVSVAETAEKLARAYDVDPSHARIAGLLHDWDKGLTDEHLRCRARDLQIDLSDEMVSDMPWVLHGPTAAAVLAQQFPQFGDEVFYAIARHTVGEPEMSAMDMIVYVADKIEPLHEVPAYRKLYKKIGKFSLEKLFFQVQRRNLKYLASEGRPLCAESVETWNWSIKTLQVD